MVPLRTQTETGRSFIAKRRSEGFWSVSLNCVGVDCGGIGGICEQGSVVYLDRSAIGGVRREVEAWFSIEPADSNGLPTRFRVESPTLVGLVLGEPDSNLNAGFHSLTCPPVLCSNANLGNSGPECNLDHGIWRVALSLY